MKSALGFRHQIFAFSSFTLLWQTLMFTVLPSFEILRYCKGKKNKIIILTQSTTTTGDELGLLLTVTLGGLGKTYNNYQLLITNCISQIRMRFSSTKTSPVNISRLSWSKVLEISIPWYQIDQTCHCIGMFLLVMAFSFLAAQIVSKQVCLERPLFSTSNSSE